MNKLSYDFTGSTAKIYIQQNRIGFEYKGSRYAFSVSGALLKETASGCIIEGQGDEIVIKFER
jgi:hypothetical protein